MNLDANDESFVARREILVRRWPFVGSVLILLVLVLIGWLWHFAPGLVNPSVVVKGLENDTIADSTLATLAAILPIMTLTCLGVVVVAIGLAFFAFANEKRLLAIIRDLSRK